MDYYIDCKYESDTCDYYINGECTKEKSECPWEELESKDKQIEDLWEEFEDVLFIEGNDLYEEDSEKYGDWKESYTLVLASEWNGFDVGTDRETIWAWFNKHHSKGVNWLMKEYK